MNLALEPERVDRSSWSDGPWDHEPDRAEWTDEATGVRCFASRSAHNGTWRGYVAIEDGHPWRRLRESARGIVVWPDGIEAHGGVFHSGRLIDGGDVHWFGFDCNHLHDRAPAGDRYAPTDVYRTLDYVRAECASLAAQAKAAMDKATDTTAATGEGES